MIQFSKWKIFFVLLCCVMGVAYAYPNIAGKDARDWMQSSLPSWLPSKTVNLGLDLQGGAHLLLDVKIEDVYESFADNMVDAARLALREEKIGFTNIRATENYEINLTLRRADQAEQARSLLRGQDTGILVDEGERPEQIRIYMTDAKKRELLNSTINQSIEVIRRRVDETGTKEPIIARQGERRILLQVPGVQDTKEIKSLLGETAVLGFHLADERSTRTQRRRAGALLLAYADETREDKIGVKRRAMITGEMLQSASGNFAEGTPAITFRLNTLGAKRFCDISSENVGRPFAIVLDDKVLSAPVIREPICGGVGQITGNFTVEEVTNLALLLRAGALPAELSFAEERTVGPSLGADSIEAGKKASMVALAAVVIFMIAIYGMFGAFACIALSVNIALIFAMLSGLQATLTLPGIAGIVLTIGMAVDANVLIFERIREEYQGGRSLMSAIDSGYARAMATIMDANITTLIAAVLLYSFGTGPIKGFAVTLAIGILTSLFSSIMVTRLLVVTWLLRGKKKTELPLK
jgi:preprotein translocase subunit SecD